MAEIASQRMIIHHVKNVLKIPYPLMVLTKEDNLPSRRTAESLGLVYQPTFDRYQGQGMYIISVSI
ncbi:hypothetical protein M0R79_05105 [Ignavigranum ruoffiae]|uniref:hypothetical protein n=1 Tax=Ignavigranum ruoffiae TaxID=89093 RepID=UPI002058862F|nr:hypothetical protein [Ignavigranum ruoffiae]UPQ85058.1 hypothetical protein M0R79_05105 [Ignavigranum ruoffiae]